METFFRVQTTVEVTRLASKNKTYNISPVYLKKGDYRVKVVVGPYVWWKSFTVDKESVLIECDFLKNTNRELNISTYVYDSVTGKDITAESEILVYYKNKWVNINSIPKEDIKSGTIWKVKACCKGYEDETFSLLIDWYQDRLFISSELRPKGK